LLHPITNSKAALFFHLPFRHERPGTIVGKGARALLREGQ
jgi:hypothetical protein